MEIKAAGEDSLEIVRAITVRTIETVYPRYYPKGAVDFFLMHHCDENILTDIRNRNVFICCDDNTAVGTVTVKGNEICRLFVLPEYQGRGYGSKLIEFAEQRISENHNKVMLDSSLPAKPVYLKRGYKPTEFHSIKTANGDFLCYDVMMKIF